MEGWADLGALSMPRPGIDPRPLDWKSDAQTTVSPKHCTDVNAWKNWRDVLQEWVVLGSLDLDEFAFQNLKTLQDWERNFKAVKARGRDAEKLPKFVVLVSWLNLQSVCAEEWNIVHYMIESVVLLIRGFAVFCVYCVIIVFFRLIV